MHNRQLPDPPSDDSRDSSRKVVPLHPESPSAYLIVQMARAYYQRTGRSKDPIVAQIARAAYHRRSFVQPKAARHFLAKLQAIEDRLFNSVLTLIEGLDRLASSTSRPSAHDWQALTLELNSLMGDVEGLVMLARHHSDQPARSSDGDEINCFQPLAKLTSDVLYSSQYLREHLRGDRLYVEFSQAEFIGIPLQSLCDGCEDVQRAVLALSYRLRQIVLSQVPGIELEETL